MHFSYRTFLLSAILIGSLSAQAHAYCSSEGELQALNTRVLQSELMVAALACGQQQEYNAFVTRFEPLLVERGRKMRNYFTRNYGGSAERALNRFVTRIANDAAQRGLQTEETEYCENTRQQFDQILSSSSHQIDAQLIQANFQTSHGIKNCGKSFVADAAATE